MKDIKSYVIGFLSCTCLFLIMGQTKSDNQIGRYQKAGDYLIDTTNGKMWAYDLRKQNIDGFAWFPMPSTFE